MGKKKRQSEPSGDVSQDSSESCDENQNSKTKGCSHAAKGVELPRIKRSIKGGLHGDCPHCDAQKLSPDNDGYEYDMSLWLCLKCGHQGCGRTRNEHALKHYNTPHSDSHALCVNTTLWTVWCYDCDNDVNANTHKKLLEAVEWLKKQNQKEEDSSNSSSKLDNSGSIVMEPLLGSGTFGVSAASPFLNNQRQDKDNVKATLPRVRGLSNLGNTCFFNAVMQCLAQTPFLLTLLEETRQSGEHFHLPGGKMNPDDKDSKVLEPLDGILEGWRPMTQILAETLKELQSGRSDTYNPRMLFDKLKMRMPQFAGGDQHDSHELLRHLLEAVREEDLRRYKTVILEKLGMKTSINPAMVDDDTKKVTRFYGNQASDFLLRTEQAFRGVLVSTLQCQDCDHLSHRDEVFLDLSLPIAEKQVPPPSRRKFEDADVENKPSKHMVKKQKQAARKGRKNKLNQKKTNNLQTGAGDENNADEGTDAIIVDGSGLESDSNEALNSSTGAPNNSDSESDADIEDNAEDTASSNANNEDQPKGTESGYNSDKIGDTSPDQNSNGSPDDSGVPSPYHGPEVKARSPASSDSNTEITNEERSCSTMDAFYNRLNGPESMERPVSRLAFAPTLDNKLASLSISPEDNNKKSLANDSASGQPQHTLNNSLGSANSSVIQQHQFRYQCEEGECSVQSCLNQFTARELMTANNKVGCEQCTKRYGGSEKKTVYTNASKQLLVKFPPPVLILHLKRFQVFRCIRKMSKHVTFPLVLDLAPFCSDRSRKSILYSLYGVVEHSGHLHGGHYVAYVKVRAPVPADSPRWQFLPRNQQQMKKKQAGDSNDANETIDDDEDITEEDNAVGGDESENAEGVKPIPGQWYYVSDSHVSEVSESKVLKTQAYLLFYERIL